MKKTLDLSKFAQKVSDVKNASSSDNMNIFLLKSLLPTLSNKVKYIIGVVVYLILIGIIINIYWLIRLMSLIF